jgi:diguanylate cyclase (GGDEF)-like protein
MNLDPRTLLFSLILTNALTVVCLLVAARGNGGRREGLGLWALAMMLDTVTWILVAARGAIPDVFSLVVANGLKAGAHALVLAAICEFQRRAVPRWQYYVPVALAMLMAAVFADDIRSRFIWGGLIFGFQILLIARVLMTHAETRAGRAWRLLFAGLAAILFVLSLRVLAALFSADEFAQPQNAVMPHPVQIVSYVAIMATVLLGSIGFVLMVKERTDREVMELAMTDSLTGVPNRRALMEMAEHVLARRDGQPIAMLMIDVDRFKGINDNLGHLAGDAVLRQVSRLLAGRLRSGDMLGRYGGEEFCVIAPDTDAEGALTLAESLREVVAFRPLSVERQTLPLTVSIGVALCPADNVRELKDMLAEADAALYAAKEGGRNRVTVFGQPA